MVDFYFVHDAGKAANELILHGVSVTPSISKNCERIAAAFGVTWVDQTFQVNCKMDKLNASILGVAMSSSFATIHLLEHVAENDQWTAALEALREASKAHKELAASLLKERDELRENFDRLLVVASHWEEKLEKLEPECDRLREGLDDLIVAVNDEIYSGLTKVPDTMKMAVSFAKQALASKETPNLDALIESARSRIMTPEERRAQVISFAYGNLAIENPAITRKMVERAYDELAGKEAAK